MEYKIREKTQSKIVAEVINSSDEIDKAKKEAYTNLSKKIKIPGFRLGKAPYEIGASYIGNERLLEEAFENLLDKSILELLNRENIDPLTKPKVDVKEFSNEKFVYEISIEFLPHIDFDPDKKIEIKKTIEVTQEEIEAKLKELQDTFTELEPKDAPVELGDIVEVSYSVNGKEEKSITFEVGRDKVIDGFEEKIVGKNTNEEFVVETQNSSITFKVISVKRKKVPALTDEFAKEIGANSIDELKEKIKNEIYENKKLQLLEDRGRVALHEIVHTIDVELPQEYINDEVELRYKEYETEYLKHGLKLESLLEKEGKSVEDFKNELKDTITHELKETIILREIIEKKNIQVNEDEIKEEFEHILQQEHLAPGSVKMNDEIRRYIKNELLKEKALSILKENAIIIFGGE